MENVLTRIKHILVKGKDITLSDLFNIQLILISAKNQIWMYEHLNNDGVGNVRGSKSVRNTILPPLNFATKFYQITEVFNALDCMYCYWRDSNGDGIYIHCKGGRGRSGIIAAAFIAIFLEPIQNLPTKIRVEMAYQLIK